MNKTITLPKKSTQAYLSRGSSKISNTIWSLLLLLVVFIAGCKKDDFKGEISGICPVVSTDPADKAVDVALGKLISATFNNDMNPSTINKTTFTIKQGTTLIDGTVSPTANPKVFTFKPTVALLPFTTYTGTISTAAQDTLRSKLPSDYVWTFTTIPEVQLSASPVLGGAVLGAGLFAQSSSVTVNANPNPGYAFVNWTAGGVVASITPSYTFTMAGNKALVANFALSSNFNVILSSNPALGGTTSGAGSYGAGSTVEITATPNSGYTFTNWSGDATGSVNPLTFTISGDRNIVAHFAVGGPIIGVGAGPGQINFGSAADFSILTKSGISTTGTTRINGNIGVSPASATAITGFGLIMDSSNQFSISPIVVGRIYASDYSAPTPAKMTTAVNDMETAYTTANGLTTPAPIVDLYAGDISGRILAPGLYKWGTGVLITNAGVTLNGGPNDTWVFQISQNLTVNSSAIVHLTGGAQAKNITWVVAGQATLGTNVIFSGNILSKTLISLNTGAKVTGKLLAQTAVTLNASTVIQP
jgi:uncharacterized repeat protein (TIGR02543 family)